MAIRPWMNLIMGLIRPEHLELFALELISLCLHSTIYKYQPKHGQNIYDHKILDEFKYGSNGIRTT